MGNYVNCFIGCGDKVGKDLGNSGGPKFKDDTQTAKDGVTGWVTAWNKVGGSGGLDCSATPIKNPFA